MILIELPDAFDAFFGRSSVGQGEIDDDDAVGADVYVAYRAAQPVADGRLLELLDQYAPGSLELLYAHARDCEEQAQASKDTAQLDAARTVMARIDDLASEHGFEIGRA